MKKLAKMLLASLLAGVVLMAAGFVFWGLLPIGKDMNKPLPNATAIVDALKQQNTPEGVYIHPYSREGMSDETFAKQSQSGPYLQVFYQPNGFFQTMTKEMVKGYAHFAISAFLVCLLVGLAQMPRYGRRVVFIALLGIFGAVAIDLANPIWWHHPWMYHATNVGFQIASWMLAAFVIAALVKPEFSRSSG